MFVIIRRRNDETRQSPGIVMLGQLFGNALSHPINDVPWSTSEKQTRVEYLPDPMTYSSPLQHKGHGERDWLSQTSSGSFDSLQKHKSPERCLLSCLSCCVGLLPATPVSFATIFQKLDHTRARNPRTGTAEARSNSVGQHLSFAKAGNLSSARFLAGAGGSPDSNRKEESVWPQCERTNKTAFSSPCHHLRLL
ncbi:hypothetical protein BKA81DRAFT_107247 [Phyllosticta paracitricarpa]